MQVEMGSFCIMVDEIGAGDARASEAPAAKRCPSTMPCITCMAALDRSTRAAYFDFIRLIYVRII